MELGILPKIDQYRDNQTIKTQQIQESSASSELKTSTKPEEIFKKSIEDEVHGVKDVSKSTSKNIEKYQEQVVLANANFGFNSESQDFYIKVERGNAKSQYPTDEMMRFKSFMRNEISSDSEANS